IRNERAEERCTGRPWHQSPQKGCAILHLRVTGGDTRLQIIDVSTVTASPADVSQGTRSLLTPSCRSAIVTPKKGGPHDSFASTHRPRNARSDRVRYLGSPAGRRSEVLRVEHAGQSRSPREFG